MLRIRLDINGREIGVVGVLNTQEYDGTDVLYKVFDIREPEEDKTHLTDYPEIAEVWHDRRDGASGLTAKVMDEIGDEYLDRH